MKILIALMFSLSAMAETQFFKAQKSCISSGLAFSSKGQKVTDMVIIKETISFCDDALIIELSTDNEAMDKIAKHPEMYGCVVAVANLAKANNKDMDREMVNQTASKFCANRK